MIRGNCPTCGKTFAVDRIDELPSFPFCSQRCRLIDLGRWIDECHVIPERTTGMDDEAFPDAVDGVEADPDME